MIIIIIIIIIVIVIFNGIVTLQVSKPVMEVSRYV